MIDLNVSIFITIGLDCCNSYSQKAFHNSCRCKYFKRDFIFHNLVGTSISEPKFVINIYWKENFIEDSTHICSQDFQNNSNVETIWLDRFSHQNVYYFSWLNIEINKLGPCLAKIHPNGTLNKSPWVMQPILVKNGRK